MTRTSASTFSGGGPGATSPSDPTGTARRSGRFRSGTAIVTGTATSEYGWTVTVIRPFVVHVSFPRSTS
ncbi:MAG TPA: hypothetical protein VE442_02660 [Jatrophihabitans sp.]|nr:hypothetical protein [Jatrophihabitans sp.]